MTVHRIKLFEADFAAGYMQAATVDADMHLHSERFTTDPLPRRDQWHPFRADWWHRTERRVKVPGLSRHFTSLCIRGNALSLLGSDVERQVEQLPFTVEGEPWCMLRPLHRLKGVDPATSVPIMGPIYGQPGESRVHRYAWINAIDPHAEQAMIFDTGPDGGVTWVTEDFVRRVKAAGLEGLRWVHKGYLVRDWADARPRPVPKPRASASSQAPAPALVSDLAPALRALRDQARALADQALPAVTATTSADECLTLLDDWLAQGHRVWKRLDEAERARRIDAAAAVFGDLVCRKLGWHWATLRRGDEAPRLTVASADRRCAIPLQRFAERQFLQTERTVRLLFNMLRAGQLPSAPFEGAALIG